MAKQPNSCLDFLVLRFKIAHNQTDSVMFLLMGDQLVTAAATYTTRNTHTGKTFMPSAGFELAIPAIK